MAWGRQQLICTDAGFGINAVNGIINNQATTIQNIGLAHVVTDALGHSSMRLGAHDHPPIARATVRVHRPASVADFEAFQSGLVLNILTSGGPGACSLVCEPGYSMLKAHGVPLASSAVPRFVSVKNFAFMTPATGRGMLKTWALVCRLYELNAGAMVLTDFDFSLTVYGVRQTAPPAAP